MADEIDIEEFHTGNGWYDIPGAAKQVRGEEAARKKLAEVLEDGPDEEAEVEDTEEVEAEVEEVTEDPVVEEVEAAVAEQEAAEDDDEDEEYNPYSHIPVQMRPKKPTREGLPPVQQIPAKHRERVLKEIEEAEAADAEPEESDEEE